VAVGVADVGALAAGQAYRLFRRDLPLVHPARREPIVSAVSNVLIATSDQTYFTYDSVGIRATWRTGHSVVRPDRIGVFSLATTYTVALGSPSAGNFTLTFAGATTANIAFGAAASAV
jgi:hypothetical protein